MTVLYIAQFFLLGQDDNKWTYLIVLTVVVAYSIVNIKAFIEG